MATCFDCEDELDDVFKMKVAKKTIKLCEDCYDVRKEQAEIDGEAQATMMDMMGWKGR